MTDAPPPPTLPRLTPPPYLAALISELREAEPDVWRWATSVQARGEYAEQVRADLLKETYRLEAEAHPELHRCCQAAAGRLGIAAPVTLYQRGDGAMNAALYFVPGEAHVVFSGPLLERLHGAELEAVLGHELSHYLLWQLDGGAYHAADRILGMAAGDPRASASQLQSARLFRLYTEVFADRGGAIGCAALLPAVNALVKTQTGLTDVSGVHYLKQADEICAPQASTAAAGVSHPETFIRARALRLWCEADPEADSWLRGAIEGPLSLDTLDMLAQRRLSTLTGHLIRHLLSAPALQSDALLAHARRYFPDFQPGFSPDLPGNTALAAEIAAAPGVHDYLAYVLADFAAADGDLDDVPLAAALDLAQRLELGASFERVALQDLAVSKRRLSQLKQDSAAPAQTTGASHA